MTVEKIFKFGTETGKIAYSLRVQCACAFVCLAGYRQGIYFLAKGDTSMRQKAQIMDEAAPAERWMRISHEITEKNRGVDNVVLVGDTPPGRTDRLPHTRQHQED